LNSYLFIKYQYFSFEIFINLLLVFSYLGIFFNNLKVSMMKLRLQKSIILPLFLLISSLIMPYNLKAVTKTWIGLTGNWNVPSKWSPAGIPSSTDVVVISGATSIVTVPKGYWARAQQVTLSGCSLTLNGTSRLSVNNSAFNGFQMNQGTIFRNKGILEIDNVMLNAISTVGTGTESSFINEGTIKIGSRGSIGATGVFLTNTVFANLQAGRIFVDAIGLEQYAMIIASSSNFSNEGEINFGSAATVERGIDNEGPADFTNNGTITFTNVSDEGISARTKVINNGTIAVAETCTLQLDGSIRNEADGYITIDGTVNINTQTVGSTTTVGSISNFGFLTIFPSGKLIDNANFMSEGFIRNFGILSVQTGKTFSMTGSATFFNEITGVLNVAGSVNINAGFTFNSIGTTQGDFNIYQNGDFISDVNSRIAPGTELGNAATNGIAKLTTNGNLDLMSGMLDIEANGADSPSLYDYLNVVGSFTIGASSKLKVVHGGGYVPVTGDEITVVKSVGAVTGTFATANIDIPSGWKVRYDYPATGDVTLTYIQILPVELLSFKAANKGVSNLLTWETASEITNAGFEVQRKGEQGEWAVLGFVKGNGAPSVYNFTDNNPLSISYYRLRQVDHDGKSELSKVVSVVKERKLYVQIYPNPTAGRVSIKLEAEANADVTVFNLVGQVVMANEKVTTVGEIDLSGLARGTYIVEIKSEGVVARQKVVKQ
jgi:Secretion system C-terminal sorting domain